MSMRWKALVLVLTLAALLWPRQASAAPQIVITPASGPPTAEFVAQLSGFSPGESIHLRISTTAAATAALDIPALRIGSDGSYRLSIAALLLPTGTYTVTALRAEAVVASADFVVTAARATPTSSAPRTTPGTTPTANATRPVVITPTRGMPGLPTTGGGYAPTATPTPSPWLLLGALGLIPLIAIGQRRRNKTAGDTEERPL